MADCKMALIGIIVENIESSDKINQLLHDNSSYIVGRMGIPYRSRAISIISVVIDAPENIVTSLTAKLEKLPGVGVKTVFSSK